MDPDDLLARLREVRSGIDRAAIAARRTPGDVKLLLATKTVPAQRIAIALGAGFTLIGENRVQEVLAKAAELAAHPHRQHFIGHLQSNKINSVLPHLDCLQTVDDAALARRLESKLAAGGRILDVMVQVNVSGEGTKSGVSLDDAPAMVKAVVQQEHLRLIGFMTIGANSADESVVRSGYALLRQLRDGISARGWPGTEHAAELSMGMSGDYPLAIAEGATIVRIGSAVFGARG